MCTLIYWAKLVPLLHINIDEGERSFGGQPEDFYHVAPLLLTQLIRLEVSEGGRCFLNGPLGGLLL